jgi:hypothetical protein
LKATPALFRSALVSFVQGTVLRRLYALLTPFEDARVLNRQAMRRAAFRGENSMIARRVARTKRILTNAIPVFALLVVAFLCIRGARTSERQPPPAPPQTTAFSVPALGRAMADFTGDSHPDLATVRLNAFDSPTAQYLIEIHLSEGGGQSLRLIAPFGGLLITPKDVTGDGNLDLVVRSARSRAPIAVFLNDGRGHFSWASVSLFAKDLRDVPSELRHAPDESYSGAALISSEPYTIAGQSASIRNPRAQGRAALPSNIGNPPHPFALFASNRAPPAIA